MLKINENKINYKILTDHLGKPELEKRLSKGLELSHSNVIKILGGDDTARQKYHKARIEELKILEKEEEKC